MENLKALENPDVSFAGLSGALQLEIGKKIAALNPEQGKIAMQKLTRKIQADANPSGTKTSRDDMKERLAFLPDEIQEALMAKRAQISDQIFYWNKVVGAVTSKEMIANADAKGAGVTNMDKAQLPKDAWFLLKEIWVLSGVNATLSTTAYGAIADAIANGELELKIDNKQIMPVLSTQVFKRGTAEAVGRYVLDNPKLLEPLKDLRATFTFSEAAAANTNIKLMFVGSIIQSY